MFNKFTPLEDGELKNKINALAKKIMNLNAIMILLGPVAQKT